MAKTRMNSGHRTILKEFAQKKIKEVIDRKQENKLYKQVVTATNAVIRKKYSEKDMETLRKYNLAIFDNCSKYVFPSGRVEGFEFRSSKEKHDMVDIPYRKGCYTYSGSSPDVYQMPESFERLVDEHNKLKKENDDLEYKKTVDCNSLIEFAKYIEDVLEVIKVPTEIENKLLSKSTALVALSPDVIARIQADFSA